MAKKIANVLSQKEMFAVMSYISANRDMVEKWPRTISDLCDHVSKATGVKVTTNNIRTMSDAAGVKLNISGGNHANYIYAKLLREVESMRGRLDALDSRLDGLFKKLGEK